MFTIIGIKNLGKSGVKWGIVLDQQAPIGENIQNSPQIDELIGKAKGLMEEAKSYKDTIVSARILRGSFFTGKGLESQFREIYTLDSSKKDTIIAMLDDAISLNNADKKIYEEIKVSVEKYGVEASKIQVATAAATAAAVPAGAPMVSSNGALKPASVDTKGEKYIFSEKDFEKALSRATLETGETREEIYTRIVGEAPGNPLDMKLFQEKVNLSLLFLGQLGAGNAGLYALLYGRTEEFMRAISAQVRKNNGKPLEIKSSSLEGVSPMVQNIAGALITAGVGVVSGGVIAAGHEAHNVEAQDIMDQIKKDADPTLLHRLGNGLDWIKEAFLGRKLSLTFGEERVANYKKEILEYADSVMKLDSIGLVEIYPGSIKFAQAAGVDMKTSAGMETIKKALIQSYILDKGYKAEGSNLQANIGLLFIGAGRDEVIVKAQKTGEGPANEAERNTVRRVVSSDELTQAGVSIEKKGGKWVHTIPATVRLNGDPEPIEVVVQDAKVENGVYSVSRDTVADMSFSDVNGKYRVTFSERKLQPKSVDGASILPQGDLFRKQEIGNIPNLRDKQMYTEKSDKNIPQVLYDIVGHQSEFATLAKNVSRGDMDAAKNELGRLGIKYEALSLKYKNNPKLSEIYKKYTIYIKQLQEDFDTNATIWDTFMSGNKESRAQKNPAYDTVRTKAVIAAEGRLADKSGFPKPSDEKDFRVTGNYDGRQISEIIPGQEITSVQLMTPLDEKKSNSLHRPSVNDGSFQVSDKVVFITDTDRKSQIITGLLKSSHESRGIENQLKKLNSFLKENGVDKVIGNGDYENFLISGKVDDLGVSGLKLQDGKETKFLEARAKVAGNVCLNATYAIGYPAFELSRSGKPPVKQGIEIAATMDASAALDIPNVQTRQSALGISVLGALGHFLEKKGTPGTVTTRPGEVTTITTRPGETTATILINGTPVGVVNTQNNVITLAGGGTFRLAPGQTLAQYFGSTGKIPPIETIVAATDGSSIAIKFANSAAPAVIFIAETVNIVSGRNPDKKPN